MSCSERSDINGVGGDYVWLRRLDSVKAHGNGDMVLAAHPHLLLLTIYAILAEIIWPRATLSNLLSVLKV